MNTHTVYDTLFTRKAFILEAKVSQQGTYSWVTDKVPSHAKILKKLSRLTKKSPHQIENSLLSMTLSLATIPYKSTPQP